MAGFIQNILWNSVQGFVEAGTRSAGEYAGNALIKAGDMIENGGRGVGNSIEKKAVGYGSSISGQTYQPLPKALPSTARKPVVKRSKSLPAKSEVVNGAVKIGGAKALEGRESTGGKHVNGASKAGGLGIGAAKSMGGSSATGTKSTAGVKGTTSSLTGSISKPKSHSMAPTRSNSLPRPYPSAEKKSMAKPRLPKPFTPPVEQKKLEAKKTYPGTDTMVGQGSRVPVQNQKPRYKPLPRLGPQVGQGQTMKHLAV